MILSNWFYRLMYRTRILKFKAESGRNYIVEYHRSPFWTDEKPSLKLFFKKKYTLWHGQVWEVFGNGKCGFGTYCVRTWFPRREMKRFLRAEVHHLEKIFNHEYDEGL